MLQYLYRGVLAFFLVIVCTLSLARAEDAKPAQEYVLGAGDIVKVTVFQNPDLAVETRVSENGTITYPLLGAVDINGMTAAEAEKKIAAQLRERGFVQQPQVNLLVVQVRGNQVAVLGQVARPGRYPLETANTRLSDVLALAGGATPTGSDVVVLSGIRDGKAVRMELDIPALYLGEGEVQDVPLRGGDVLYVHRAPQFYIYGEVQRPGAYRIERNMTIMQALAQGGGVSMRGSQRSVKVNRRDAEGRLKRLSLDLDERVQADDVVFVPESWF